eukprot:1205711-Lingulodinium_polyedra.AAC.1
MAKPRPTAAMTNIRVRCDGNPAAGKTAQRPARASKILLALTRIQTQLRHGSSDSCCTKQPAARA